MTGFSVPDDLSDALARVGDRAAFADRVIWFPEVGSTNDFALARADAGADEGTVIVADAQTRGRGRHGRTWASPPGAGLYFSVVLRPPAHAISLLTLATGVAVAEGIQAATGFSATLKWPNDVWATRETPHSGHQGHRGLATKDTKGTKNSRHGGHREHGEHERTAGPPRELGGRKLGGVLAEAGSSLGGVAHVVVGVGLNVHRAVYPAEVAARASSLEDELGRPVDRGLLLAESLAALWARYDDLKERRAAEVLDAWRARARPMLGRPVTWESDGRTLSGVADGIDDTGALLVRTATGVARVISGQVHWVEATNG